MIWSNIPVKPAVLVVWDPIISQPYSCAWDGQITTWDNGTTTWDDGTTTWEDATTYWLG